MRRLVLALALCATPLAAPAESSDKDFLTAFLESNLSSAGRQVTITGFQGALSTRASLAELTIADDRGIWLTVRDVTLDWSQSELLSGKVVIDEFSAGEIVLERLPPGEGGTSPEAGRFQLPDLPVSIDITKIEARHIALGAPVLGQAVEGSLSAEMHLAGGEGSARLALMRKDAGPEGRFTLDVDYRRDTGLLSLALEAVEGPGGIAVSALGVPGRPAAELTVKGQGPAGGFDADVRLATDGVTRLAGKVRAEATPEGPGFVADLSGDPTPVFLPAYAAFFGPEVRLQASGHRRADGGYELQDFGLTTAALALQGQLSLDAAMVPEVMALTGQIGLPDGAPVVLPLATPRETRVASAGLSLTYDRAQGEAWLGKAEVTGLDHAALTARTLRLTGQGHILRTGAGAKFDGLFDFAAEGMDMADAALATALGRSVAGRARADWLSGGALQLTDLALKGDGFDLTSTGTLGDLAQGLVLAGTLRGEIGDLARWSDLTGLGLKGAASLDLAGSATLITGAADVTGQLRGKGLALGMPLLDGMMGGESLLDLSLKRDETGTALRRLALDLPDVKADLAGMIASDGIAISGTVALSDLGALAPGFGGALAGDLTLSGALAAPDIALSAKGRDLSTGQRQLDLLLAGESGLTLRLTPDAGGLSLRRAEVVLPQARLTATGRLGGGKATLGGAVRLDDLAALGLGLSGRVQGDWRFVGPPGSGSLTLEAEATALSTGAAPVDLLLTGPNALSARLDLVPEGARLAAFDLKGARMSLSATGLLGAAEQRLQVVNRIADLALLVPGLTGALETRGEVRRDAAGLTLDLSSQGPGQIAAKTTGRLSPDLTQADLAITGTASAAVANGFAAPRSLSGNLRYDLRLKGPLALASLSGPVEMSDGRLADPAQTFGLGGMSARFTLSGGRAQVAGSARVTSGGSVTANGTVGLTAPYAADIALSLNQVGLRDPNLYTTTVEGALTLKGPATGGAVIAGTLNMGRTELRIPSTGFSADGGLPGLQHLSEPEASRATRARAGMMAGGSSAAQGGGGFALNLRINAPNQVFIRGRGLDAELGGRLQLTGRTDAIVPQGAFNLIRGRLDILGRRLTLSEALLQMQGRLVPFVRIAASVDSGGITAQVLIEGPADDPEVRFASSPELPQEEVLARLLFDRGLESLTAFQAIQLAGAVATLAGKGGDGVIGNLRRRAGIDNLDIQTDAAGGTEVTVGKYLTDKAYTEVTLGQGGGTSLSINLDLAPHITLKGQLDSEGQTGIGVFLQRDY